MKNIVRSKENETHALLNKIDDLQKTLLEKESLLKEKIQTIGKLLDENQEKDNTIKKLSARMSSRSILKDINTWVDK